MVRPSDWIKDARIPAVMPIAMEVCGLSSIEEVTVEKDEPGVEGYY